jgi:hypothetical protein
MALDFGLDTDSNTFVRQLSSLTAHGSDELFSTDVPIVRYAPPKDLTTARRSSMGANTEAEERAMSIEFARRW